MKICFITPLLPLLLLSSPIIFNSCDAFEGQKRELKPYDPEKAGAVIIEIFDLTSSPFVSTSEWSSPKISDGYELAEYNDCIYIWTGRYIYIYDKNTLQLIERVKTDAPRNPYGYFKSGGLAINNDFAFLFCELEASGADQRMRVASIDLSSGDVQVIDVASWFDLKLDIMSFLGYNKEDKFMWFYTKNAENDSRYFYHFFQYDKDSQIFASVGVNDGFVIGNDASSISYVNGLSMYGNESWITHYSRNQHTGRYTMVALDKYNIDNPAEVQQHIDVEYLGTLSLPQSIIYDKPYIWLLVERENQVQMLKILPKE